MRAGYKQTEVGVIPEDWKVAPVGQLLRRTPSYGINAPAIPFDSRFPTYLRITDITVDGQFADAGKASVDHSDASSYVLEAGDIVFARTGASVGKSYLYHPNDGHFVFAGFLIRLSPDPDRLVPAFLSFYVQTDQYWNWIKANSMRSGQPGINGQEYASLPISFPPTKAEQEAIAEALGDADALIESLKRLLTKKRQLKQGAMYVLLSGKRRLPGFEVKPGYKQTEVGVIPEDWEAEALGDSCDLVTKGTTPTSIGRAFVNSGINFLKAETLSTTGAVIPEKLAYIDSATHALLRRSQLIAGDLLISIAGVLGRVGVVADADVPANTNQALAIIRLGKQSKIARRYLFHALRSSAISFQIRDLNVQAAQANISLQNVRDLRVPLPPTKTEQEAIAAILSDIDHGIDALETELSKARDVKQGMMQELLTGRIRLV